MREPAILAIDLGSSSARASLWDTKGDPVEDTETQLSYEFRDTPDGGVVATASIAARRISTGVVAIERPATTPLAPSVHPGLALCGRPRPVPDPCRTRRGRGAETNSLLERRPRRAPETVP